MATAAEKAAADKADADAKAAQDAQDAAVAKAMSDQQAQIEADKDKNLDADGEEAASASPSGVQKYRVLPTAAVIRASGRHAGTRYMNGAIIELDSGDDETQRLVKLGVVHLASEKPLGRITGKGLAQKANEYAQENDAVYEPDGESSPIVDDSGLKEQTLLSS